MRSLNSNSLCEWTVIGVGVLCGLARGQSEHTERASVDSAGAQALGASYYPSLSADGRYVGFSSFATNLVAGDVNGFEDVFLRDRLSGQTILVSVSSAEVQGNNPSEWASVSADGRFVAFHSWASNLVPGDGPGSADVFVRDLQSGQTICVSVKLNGMPAQRSSSGASISDDGRYVHFASDATDIVTGDTNGLTDVFVRDLQSGQTSRVNVDSAGAQANGITYGGILSRNGRYVVFSSEAANLVPGDTNARFDTFVRDLQTGQTSRVSLDSSGVQGNHDSFAGSITPDGRYVAFVSSATNLVAGDSNGTEDTFLRDRQTGQTTLVSVNSAEVQGNSHSGAPYISNDGRFVAFGSNASNMVSGDTNDRDDAFVRDLLTGQTSRASVDSAGVEGNNQSWPYAFSADGRYVAIWSIANNLVPGDTNLNYDVFVRDRDATGFTSLCDPGTSGVIACPCGNPPAGGGRGCNNFGSGPAQSGTLSATGAAYLSSDGVVLHASGENNTSLTVFWTGKTQVLGGVPHGAGVRCAGTLNRLYTDSASGGAISRPSGADPSVSARSAAVGVPISAGQKRYYFTIYRDPNAAGPCGNTASTINLTNAGAITWSL